MSFPAFFDDFYDAFLAMSPVIAGKFVNTDMAKQKRLLRDGISFMIMYFNGAGIGEMKVKQLGESHSQSRMDVKPPWYDWWVSALLAAVAMHDPKYSKETERAWKVVMGKGIEAMRRQYATPASAGA